MKQAEILRDFAALPPEAQKVVADLVALLSERYAQTRVNRKMKSTRLVDEKFIGIWKDREDMQDSNAYVRSLREREWGTAQNAAHR